VGIEPTHPGSKPGHTGFEDQESHQTPSTSRVDPGGDSMPWDIFAANSQKNSEYFPYETNRPTLYLQKQTNEEAI
jgi:hypothetical protein